MSEPILLFIVTDNPAKACLAVLCCDLSVQPSFVTILTDADDIKRIPDGARCIGHWFAWSDRRPDPAQLAWEERKSVGGIDGITDAFFRRIDEWNAKRREAEAKILAEAIADLDDGPLVSMQDIAAARAAKAEPVTNIVSFPKQSRWL